MNPLENAVNKSSILIVDDNPDNLRILTDILLQGGYKVRAALDGLLALRSLENARPDLVLLDIVMPEMDGYQVCEQVKANPDLQDVPIIFISALHEVFDKVKAFSLGGVDFITKPFKAEEVLARIRTHLEIYSLQKALKAKNLALEQEIAEHKKSQQQLQQSEKALCKEREFIQSVLDTEPNFVFVKDKQGRFIMVNKAMADFFNTTPEQMISKHNAELMAHPEEHQTYSKIEQQVLHTMKTVEVDETYTTDNGAILHFHSFKTPLVMPDDTVHVLGIAVNITARKYAEEALRFSEEKFRQFFENAPEYCFMVSPNNVILGVNKVVCQVLGYWKDELIGKPFGIIYAPESLPDAYQTIKSWKGIDQLRDKELIIINRKRERRTVLLSANTIKDKAEKITLLIYVLRDITDRKQIETALKTSERRYRLLIANLPNTSVILFDRQLKILIAEGEEIAKSNLDKTQLEGKFLQEAFPTNLKELFEPACQKALLGSTTTIEEFYNHYFYIHQVLPIQNDIGNIYGCMIVSNNVTDYKQAETDLKRAKDEAELANKAKSSFLANMSHELRTPLNGILGYTQLLQRDKTLSEQQEEGIEVIHRCGEHLLTLINDILDLSKIEAERVELYPSEFNFHNFLKTIVELFQLRAQQKALRFLYEELSILPTFVFADETRLRQILVNLLGNALKFTEQGGITFKVGYHYEEIRFQVEDTGIGIDPKEIDNIFLSFQQVGNSNYRMQGTGLGLTITRKLVEMMGGELHVESRLDQGSTFWVTLDLPEVLTPKEHKSIHETMIKYPIGFEGDPKKVLIVDDREDNRSVLNNLLKPLGFDILEAVNGQEAVAQFETYQPDLILMDLVMPIMDGFEATHLIRELPTTKAVIIIAISASAFEFHKQESQQAGCDDFIVKPFRFKELLSCLQTYLKLVWIYESDNVEIDTVTATHHPLTTTQIATLSDLIMMGDFSAILEFSKTLVQTDARHSALDKKIRQLVDPFQKKKLLELIKAYTEGTTE